MQPHSPDTRAGDLARFDFWDEVRLHGLAPATWRPFTRSAARCRVFVAAGGHPLGFSWQMLQRFEVATARLHADSADELALFYGVDVRWLLGSIPEPHSNSSQGGLMAPLLDVLPATSVAGIRGVPSISF
jgi:hypothetical protein